MRKISVFVTLLLTFTYNEQFVFSYNDNYTLIENNIMNNYYSYCNEMSEKYVVDADVLINLIDLESGFNEFAINHNRNGTKDLGIAQINSKYIKYFEAKYDMDINPFDAYQSMEFAAKHLSYLIDKFGLRLGISAYNCGESAVTNGKIPKSSVEYSNKVLFSKATK